MKVSRYLLCAIVTALALCATPTIALADTFVFDAGTSYRYPGCMGSSPSNALGNIPQYEWNAYSNSAERGVTYNGYDYNNARMSSGGYICKYANLTASNYYGIGYISTHVIFPKGSRFTFISTTDAYMGRIVTGQTGSNSIYNGEYRWSFTDATYCHIWVRNRANGQWKDMTTIDDDGWYSIDFNADAFVVLYKWDSIPTPSLAAGAADTIMVNHPIAIVDTPTNIEVTLDSSAIDLSNIEDALYAYGTLGPSGTSSVHSVAEYVRNALHTLLRIEDNQVSNSTINNQTNSLNNTIQDETQDQTDTLMDTSGSSGISLNLGDSVQDSLGGVNSILNLGTGVVNGYDSTELDEFTFPSFTWTVNNMSLTTPSVSIDIWNTFPQYEQLVKTAVTALLVIALADGVYRWYCLVFYDNYSVVINENDDVVATPF